MKKLKLIILVNIIVFIFLIIFFELILGNKIYINKLNCGYLHCSANYFYKNNVYKGKKIINYKKDKYGFRGLRKKVNEIDILTIGGSTTDQRYLEVEDTWSEKLEFLINSNDPNFNFDVVNAGIDGQSTYGHLWNFENWFSKIKNFKTKYIFFYIGVNEYFSNTKNTYDNDYESLNFTQKIKVWIKENNGLIYKTYNLVYRNFFPQDILNVGHKERERIYKPANKIIKINDENIKKLNHRLDKLIILTKELNAKPVFITQKTFRSILINGKVHSIDDLDYLSKEKKIAEIIINNCKKNNIFCIDLYNKIKFSKNSFYDLVHTNPEGSNIIAEFIYNDFRKFLKNN